ncbi:PP2C family protein-serine/threonine phosphatase [Pseudodesulfovibrio indicus]|jgi:sigma-B regulation protein RsbU (phosphoserine phosphatase)|uniref:Serine/threonine protein phosphatase n=1 Tax=Pseudodesulfovibrio indicus TaxID=1716143 RepID=A0A126QMW5_9BACT|nr:SpoIIE family protein phosphatase [Pseudodesulfovibrio indicus]AMK11261.1 serine/threonine protein phosphatase [Pseudodesulfovibrio indicus]TDT92294.1 sigma-B regulation protein RsbU (phosphoserine phosphatase) [Pseudodesulfovibrio indicus]
MGIRYKLLILLLLISLAPLFVVGAGVQKDLTHLGEGLALRSSNTLIHKASNGLKRIVVDHARVLRREKQLLESNTLFLASKIEGVLYGHAHSMPGMKYIPPADQISEATKDYFSLRMGGWQDFKIDFNNVTTLGTDGRPTELPSSSTSAMLLPLLGQVKFEYPKLALWIEVRLPGGEKLVYPRREATMRMGMHMSRSAQKPSTPINELTWSLPETDQQTGRIVFRVTAPIRDVKGKLQGDVSIIIPVGSLLHKSKHVDMFSKNAISILVSPDVDPTTNESRLKVIAQENTQKSMHDYWLAPEKDAWITSPDAEQYSAMMQSMDASSLNVTGMPYGNMDALWAYAPVDQAGVFLLLIIPKTDIVKEAQSSKEFILNQVDNHNTKMGFIVLAVAIFVLGLAFFLSRLFTRNISELATTVRKVAKGDFSARAVLHGKDEIGQLGEAINQMIPELEERVNIKNSLEVAQEVQQSLLPIDAPTFLGADIAAVSKYCDETGGDYYGFIPRDTVDGKSLVVAVGDVSGHGIPAALMMASARAYLRSNVGGGGRLDAVTEHVNELICDDVDQSGRFMTLFLLELTETNTIRWIRAGHDPAMVYDPSKDSFTELAGEGLPLGVTKDARFELNEHHDLPPSVIIIIGTDGIWEMHSQNGEMFGKDRLKNLIRATRAESSDVIIQTLIKELDTFQGEAEQDDDITIAIIKTPTA